MPFIEQPHINLGRSYCQEKTDFKKTHIKFGIALIWDCSDIWNLTIFGIYYTVLNMLASGRNRHSKPSRNRQSWSSWKNNLFSTQFRRNCWGGNQGDQSNDMVAHVKRFGMPQDVILKVVSWPLCLGSRHWRFLLDSNWLFSSDSIWPIPPDPNKFSRGQKSN